MADRDQGRPPGRAIGMEDYRAAKLRTLETVVMALVHRQEDPAWLRAMITETEALPLDGPEWVSLWRSSQLQFLNKALYGERQILADDDIVPDGEGPAQGDLWDDDPGVLLEADAIVEDARMDGSICSTREPCRRSRGSAGLSDRSRSSAAPATTGSLGPSRMPANGSAATA